MPSVSFSENYPNCPSNVLILAGHSAGALKLLKPWLFESGSASFHTCDVSEKKWTQFKHVILRVKKIQQKAGFLQSKKRRRTAAPVSKRPIPIHIKQPQSERLTKYGLCMRRCFLEMRSHFSQKNAKFIFSEQSMICGKTNSGGVMALGAP